MNPARASSAVILVREKDGAAEIFLGQRHGRATFASTFVFPGGLVAAQDSAAHAVCRDIDESDADRRLSVDRGGLDFYSAAIRELFEETGVLLATDRAGVLLPDSPAHLRARLAAGDVTWLEVLSRSGAYLATDQLHYVGHWETPVALSARFSTRFFLAELPAGQEPEHDGEELVDSRWLRPDEALELDRTGAIELPFPHMKQLELLATFDSPGNLRQWARDRWREPVTKIRPWLIEENDRRRFILPGEAGYPDRA